MRKPTLPIYFFFFIAVAALLCSCKDDSYLTIAPPIVDHSSFTETFDTTDSALARGWKIFNKSVPLGTAVWQDGGGTPPLFDAFINNGVNPGFIGVNYLSTSAQKGIISQWLVSPSLLMQNGDKIVFYTRAQKLPGYLDDDNNDSTDFANRLQLLVNTQNDSAELIGEGENTGSFTSPTDPVIDINPNYYQWHNSPGSYPIDGGPTSTAETIAQAYPTEWTRFEGKITGLSKPTNGRFAFRYFIKDGGTSGKGSGIGIDQVSYTSISK
jgi:hypothetical protein